MPEGCCFSFGVGDIICLVIRQEILVWGNARLIATKEISKASNISEYAGVIVVYSVAQAEGFARQISPQAKVPSLSHLSISMPKPPSGRPFPWLLLHSVGVATSRSQTTNR